MKKLYTFLLFLALPLGMMAQDLQHVTVQYSVGFGTGSTRDYISKTSFRGISFDYKNFGYSEKIAVGLEFSWNTFYKKADYDTYTIGETSISGTQYRYLNSFPMLVTGDYFFQNSESYVRPFAGLGVGTIYAIQTLDMGLYTYEITDWHFAMKPQAGIWVGFDDATKFSLTAEYLYGFKTQDADARQYLTINAGLVFTP